MQDSIAPREDMAREIDARLEVRRRFYTAGFFVVMIGVFLSLFFGWRVGGSIPFEVVAGAAAAPILGTGVVLWWLYVARRAALYEEVGRRVLSGK